MRGSLRVSVVISSGSPNRKRSTSRWCTLILDERQPVVVLEEGLPVRDGMHVDLREDDVAQRAAVDDLLQHAHRLVVAHVLVDREDLAGLRRLVAQLDRFLERQRQRLLRQDRLDVLLLQRMADQRRLLVGRKGEVDDLDIAGPRSALPACRGPWGCPSARRPSRHWPWCARRSPRPESPPPCRRRDGTRP